MVVSLSAFPGFPGFFGVSHYGQFFAGYLRNRADYPGDKSRLVVNPVAYPCGKPHYLMDIPVYSGGKKAFQRLIL